MNFIISLLIKFATSRVAEELIAISIDKLIKSTDSGIGKRLSETMISGIIKSRTNPSTEKTFEVALKSIS